MESALLFPMSEYWSFYLGFLALVVVILVLDLGVFHKEAHVVSFKESAIWSVIWISLALVFNLVLWQYSLTKFAEPIANQVGLEFLTGFVIEKALAVDNIFVFVIVFSYFGVPAKYQHRVLFYGIIGALFFRAIFISIGSVLMQYHWVVMAFGAFLILTGAKLLFQEDKPIDPGQNVLVRWVRKVLPITDKFHGERFFIRENGVLMATPLFLTLIFIEFTDIIFAVDSVPAIFAITKEPFIVFTSNIFAILGLRALYFMLAGVVDKFHLLKIGLALVLVFVGLKMVWLNNAFGGKFPISWSLGIIAALIGGAIVASLLIPKKPNKT
jgi:tellurite resistance protein TerC